MVTKPMTFKQLLTSIIGPGFVLLLILWACNAPSFPLPPPGPESMHFDQTAQGLATLRADPNDHIPPDAQVIVWNLDLLVGSACYAQADGSFECGPFYGDMGDLVRMTFTDPEDEKRGGSMCYVLAFVDPVEEDSRCGQ